MGILGLRCGLGRDSLGEVVREIGDIFRRDGGAGVPMVLGEGVPSFAGGAPEQTLILASSRAYDSGLVRLRYQVVRPTFS